MRADEGVVYGMIDLLLLAPFTALLSGYFIYRFRLPAAQIGLVDVPGGRKQHKAATPLVGGIAIFVAFAFGALLLDSGLQDYRPLFAGMGLLLITGVLDDLHDLGAVEKLVLQIVAGVILVFWGGLVVDGLGVLPALGSIALGWFAEPFTVVCVVALINAVNMMDGVDGLCGGLVLAMLGWLGAVLVLGGAGATPVGLAVLLLAGVVAFLAFNMPSRWRGDAAVFLGDSGSTMLGFALAWFAIEASMGSGADAPPVVIAWILALPILDTLSLMLRRALKRCSPLRPDREHLHHIFERAGFGKCTTSYLLVAVAVALGGIGVGGWYFGVPEQALWLGLLVASGLHFLLVQRAWRVMRVLRRVHDHTLEASEG